jgi:TATA-box binding protein (TBP) (component of TFIID and TFIIIB)
MDQKNRTYGNSLLGLLNTLCPDLMVKFKIESVVASTIARGDLEPVMAISLEGSEDDPERFPGPIHRLKEPKIRQELKEEGLLH